MFLKLDYGVDTDDDSEEDHDDDNEDADNDPHEPGERVDAHLTLF